jgi:uncharacterized Zn-finger protein
MAIDPPEIIEVEDATVACDGGGGALGHPRVFLNLGADGRVDCPYCDRQFVRKPGARTGAAH